MNELAEHEFSAETPFAVVRGEPLLELPKDLYIPPDALEVFLETFEGPLDLLLYLIRKENLDILDIPIVVITRQYMSYIEMMQDLRLELAAEYLVMAAMLAEIKSRMLLPRPVTAEESEADPRAELVRRLQEYERFKQAAQTLDNLPREDRDTVVVNITFPHRNITRKPPEVDFAALTHALSDVLKRVKMFTNHRIQSERLSVRERMASVLARLSDNKIVSFFSLFSLEEGRGGVIVSFLAILELLKESLIDIILTEQDGHIYIKASG